MFCLQKLPVKINTDVLTASLYATHSSPRDRFIHTPYFWKKICHNISSVLSFSSSYSSLIIHCNEISWKLHTTTQNMYSNHSCAENAQKSWFIHSWIIFYYIIYYNIFGKDLIFIAAYGENPRQNHTWLKSREREKVKYVRIYLTYFTSLQVHVHRIIHYSISKLLRNNFKTTHKIFYTFYIFLCTSFYYT